MGLEYDYSDTIMHYGTPHVGMTPHSGRYRWGSGQDPQKHWKTFRNRYFALRAKGLTEKQIADAFGMKTEKLRAYVSITKDQEMAYNINRARNLKEHGYANTKIAELMNCPESTVRSWLKEGSEYRTNATKELADQLEGLVNKYKYLDVGEGVNLHLGTSETRLATAIAMLETRGYKKQNVRVDQLGTKHQTTIAVLTKGDVPYAELFKDRYKIKALGSKIIDDESGIRLFENAYPIKCVDGKRVMIRYNEEGGLDRDGCIELRRGVDDISLGKAMYAQVRIGVDDKHFLKGMAMYADDEDFPPGVDIIFNTNKHLGTPPEKVFKPLTGDKTNPFGAALKPEEKLDMIQRYYYDKEGKRQLSAINVVNEQGDWNAWSKTLSSQFLSKQPVPLIKRQLDLTYNKKLAEYEEIMALTNPTVRKKLLASFGDECDASASDLKATGFKDQATKVLLPFPDIPEGKVYAPTLKDGTKVALVRHPHGGTYEIPFLTVDNKISKASRIIPNAPDAIGINKKTADQLSGADCDGDTVIMIPVNANRKIAYRQPFPELLNFDTKERYPYVEGMKEIKKKGSKQEQTEMGKVSNLLNDMTQFGASDDEIIRATKHSMVVIDAAKHHLNYKLSEQENGILALKKKYQGSTTGGAATLITRAGHEVDIPQRKITVRIDPVTGKKIYEETGKTYVNKQGKTVLVTEKATLMDLADDAYKLTSGGSKENPGTPTEALYADYANKMKALANTSRLSYINAPSLEYKPEAAKKYSKEVESLDRKLTTALKNAPLERQAQLVGNSVYQMIKDANPDMDNDHLKKAKGRSLQVARDAVGAKKQQVDITDKEWEAIQAGAIHDTTLTKILNNANLDTVKRLATPHDKPPVSAATKSKVLSMFNAKTSSGPSYTLSDISEATGLSTSAIYEIVNAD